jgi:hypothetical protein
VRVDHARAALPKGNSIKGAAVAAHMRAAHEHLTPYFTNADNWPLAPLTERVGCATCRARCRYGARVAASINAKEALAQIAQANRMAGIRDDQGNVRLAALDPALDRLIAPIRRPDDDAHDLKHCVLTHFTDDDSALARHARLAAARPPEDPDQANLNQDPVIQ